ncbi:MAG: TIGR00266 family protein [Phycisphaerales bacterium]
MHTPDVLDYQIIGDDLQAVVVTLDPGEAAVAEAGAMLYMDDGIEMESALSMKSEDTGMLGKLFEAGKRMMAGESMFVTFFKNMSGQRREVAFSSAVPGPVVPIQLHDHGGQLLCQRDAFLCAAKGVVVDLAFTKRFGSGLFGGEGFVLQKLSSPDGKGQAFLQGGGAVIVKDLAPEQILRVDTGCLIAMETTIGYEVEMVKGMKNKLFGGEGLFNMRFRGPGRVWLQSMPFSRLADRIMSLAPSE